MGRQEYLGGRREEASRECNEPLGGPRTSAGSDTRLLLLDFLFAFLCLSGLPCKLETVNCDKD